MAEKNFAVLLTDKLNKNNLQEMEKDLNMLTE
jgi:hypothetical protein